MEPLWDFLESLWPCYSCCRQQFWIPAQGTFAPSCLTVVGQIPAWTALLVLFFRYCCGPLWHRRPIWLRTFAAEADVSSPPSSGKRKAWTVALTVLVLLFLAGICFGLIPLFLREARPIFSISIVPCLVSGIVLAVDRPRTMSGAVFLTQAGLLLVQLLLFVTTPGLSTGWPAGMWLGSMSISATGIIIMLNMPLRSPTLPRDDIAKPFDVPKSALRSPEDLITLWQWMTVSWMGALIGVGRTRQIHGEDVWFLPFEFQHTRLHQLFRDVKGSVTGRILKANGPDLILTCCLGVFESISSLSEVVFLKQMLAALDADEPNQRAAVVYGIFILLSRLAQAQSGVFSLWFSRRSYERSRGEMITMIYEKTLRRKAFTFPSGGANSLPPARLASGPVPGTVSGLDGIPDDVSEPANTNVVKPSAFQSLWTWLRWGAPEPQSDKQFPAPVDTATPEESPASTGKILNLMRNDVYEVAQRFWEFPSLVTKPLNFILSMTLIWRFLGPAALLGLAFLVAGQLINAGIIRWQLRVERARRGITDSKLQMTSQFVESIRHLRWYDWHDKWLSEIMTLRQAELSKRLLSNLLNSTIVAVNQFAAYLFPVAGFFAYTVVTGKPLRVEVAFPALDLFSLLQVSLRELPGLVTVLLNARVAMGRIENFMAEPDKESETLTESDRAIPPQGEPRIEVRGASFSWPGSKHLVLRNASFGCTTGLTVVCGKVGIGKTALLQAILGEVDQHGGSRNVSNEMMGYCAQSPWLESMSIRENILFCRDLDERRYRQVLDTCCLIPDLENFKAGDLSMIGENGVGLSGGQKARVALARALYSQARILLLDDPIAALDHQTAETILRKLFANRDTSLAAGRLIVFVTHRVNLITMYADQVLEVHDSGTIETIDREQLETNKDLQQLASEAVAHEDVIDDEALTGESTAVPDKFIEEERRAAGGVMAAVYWKYVKAGSLSWWAFLIACHIFFRIARVWYFWFLKQWGEAYGEQASALVRIYHDDASPLSSGGHMQTFAGLHAHPQQLRWPSFDLNLPDPGTNVNPWLLWFFIISMVQAVAHTVSDFVLIVIIYNAGKRLFTSVMQRVSNATFRFYDVTPVGRLMNRLTSDIGTIDGQIAGQLMNAAWFGISWLSSVVVIASAAPSFLLVTVIMSATFIYIFVQFLPTSQSLRRLEMVSLSPMMSNFGTLLEGLITVRAFRAQADFQQRMVATTDTFQKMDHFYWSLQSWLTYRFELCAALATFTLTITALTTGLSAGSVGFVLAAASNFVIATHSLCKKYGELQMQFVSVERVIELLDLEQEDSDSHKKPPASWPTYSDEIEFDHVTLRYAPGLEPSLQDVSFRIPAGSTVAVTGRTGSGKSTLALSLLATVLPDPGTGGAIRIGGIDISTVDKHALRRSVTFVAQDPVLFPGTLQDNLDPQREHSDAECAAVLARVMHGGASEGLTLQSRVDGGGKNLSQGQRQLVGLGRAVLRRSPVVILDEATASIDVETAFYIQEVLREELKHSTVITIAHRVEAVKDADYRIVFDKGRVLECGPI